jgi:hypothetical protein
MRYTTLEHVAYLKHPNMGTVRITWNNGKDGPPDDPYDDEGMVWFLLTLSNIRSYGSDFLVVNHLEESPMVGGYSVLHHLMEGCYEKQRSRLIWNGLVRMGWTRCDKT